jgi:hypothetical protein
MVHTSTQALGDWLPYAHVSAPTWQPGDTMDVTAVLIEPFAETITPHFDAAMAATADVEPVWAGAANASVSRGLRPYQRVIHATRLTAYDPAGYLRALIWPNPQVAYPGNGFRVREAVVAFADTEAAARDAVATFFDGNNPDTSIETNDWSGAANASTSIQTIKRSPLRALDAPTQSVTYTLTGDTEFKEVWVPVPDGYTFHVGGLYARTGTANVKVTTDSQAVTELVPDMNPAVHVIPATAIANTGGGVTLSLTGVGTITLVGLMGQVLPDGRVPTMNTFASGQGTSGSRFVGDPSINGYSAVRDHMALSVRLKETGAWDE